MIDGWILTLTATGAVGTGLVAGVFFAFSTFVMRALDRLPPAQGVAAMNSISVTVINPLFMLALMGTAGVCVVLGVAAIVKWNEPGAGLVLAGSVSYLVLTILVTMAYHVPRNDALARRDPAAANTARYWAHHVTTWTAGNHLRVVGALAAAVLFTDRARTSVMSHPRAEPACRPLSRTASSTPVRRTTGSRRRGRWRRPATPGLAP